jgi:response regulator of citrate/malate metabolism
MDNQSITPQLSDMEVKATGNPLQMRGLMHVLSSSYTEGMSLDDLQVAVGTAVQQQLQQSLQGLDPATAQSVMSFLQNVDYTLTLDYNKEVRTGKSM